GRSARRVRWQAGSKPLRFHLCVAIKKGWRHCSRCRQAQWARCQGERDVGGKEIVHETYTHFSSCTICSTGNGRHLHRATADDSTTPERSSPSKYSTAHARRGKCRGVFFA